MELSGKLLESALNKLRLSVNVFAESKLPWPLTIIDLLESILIILVIFSTFVSSIMVALSPNLKQWSTFKFNLLPKKQNNLLFSDIFKFNGKSFNELKSTSESGIRVGFTNNTEQCGGYVYLYNLNNSSKYSFNTFQNIQENACMSFGGGVYPNASTVNAIRVYADVNIDNAVVKLYGVKQIWVT